MRKQMIAATVALLVFLPVIAGAATDHAAHRGGVAHEEVVDGVKATFRVTGIADELKAKGVAVPKGLKETHHLAVEFKDARSGKLLSSGVARVRVQGPGKFTVTKDLAGMDGHFGTDLELSQPGKYGIMCGFVPEDGKARQVRFWYEIK